MRHLENVGENYFEHGFIALSYSFKLIYLGVAAFIHAILPFVLITTASDGINKIIKDIDERTKKREQQVMSEFPH